MNECDDKDNENEKSPMKKNINLIQEISKLRKLGKCFPINNPKRNHIPKPIITCKKFTDNPQKFFSEDLCENVLKSYNLKKPNTKLNSPRIEKKNHNNTSKGEEEHHKKTNSTGSMMYNIKKYFEEEQFVDDIEFTEEHSLDIGKQNGSIKLERID